MPPVHNTFARTMSLTVHELRTPVTVVSGYLRMLLKEHGGPLTEKQRKMLEEADRSCTRIGALVSELSDVGKLEAGDVIIAQQDFDVAALVKEVASNMHEGDDRGVHLDVRGVNRPQIVTGDRARLGAALSALMHSAIRERGEPGAIVIECCDTTANGSIVVRIGDEDAQRLLATTPGAEFDEYRGGLGLALPLARRIIAAHRGTIWSAAGERPRAGAAVELPLKQEA